jgi:hypothetical protein
MSTPRNVCRSLDRDPNNRSEALGYRHHIMAQSEEEEHLPADDAHNETAERTTCPFYERLGSNIRATIQIIKDLLRHHTHTADSLTPQTTDELTEHNDSLKEQLNRLVEKVNLSKWSPFWRTTMKGNATAEGDFDEMERWVAKLRREVEETLIKSEVFMEKVPDRTRCERGSTCGPRRDRCCAPDIGGGNQCRNPVRQTSEGTRVTDP